MLPGLSGIEALAELRARGSTAKLFLMTTRPEPRVLAQAAALDIAVLEKPILGDRLVAAVRTALRG